VEGHYSRSAVGFQPIQMNGQGGLQVRAVRECLPCWKPAEGTGPPPARFDWLLLAPGQPNEFPRMRWAHALGISADRVLS